MTRTTRTKRIRTMMVGGRRNEALVLEANEKVEKMTATSPTILS